MCFGGVLLNNNRRNTKTLRRLPSTNSMLQIHQTRHSQPNTTAPTRVGPMKNIRCPFQKPQCGKKMGSKYMRFHQHTTAVVECCWWVLEVNGSVGKWEMYAISSEYSTLYFEYMIPRSLLQQNQNLHVYGMACCFGIERRS